MSQFLENVAWAADLASAGPGDAHSGAVLYSALSGVPLPPAGRGRGGDPSRGSPEREALLRHLSCADGGRARSPTASKRVWPHIGHIQIGNVPGRHEPGTGEIHFPLPLRADRSARMGPLDRVRVHARPLRPLDTLRMGRTLRHPRLSEETFMLTAADNELLTRTGPDTPMGQYFRRFWQPVALSRELPEPDGAPLRVNIMGEELVAFRNATGEVGLVDVAVSRIGVRTCTSAATRIAPSGASSMAGSSTWKADRSSCRMCRPGRSITARSGSRPIPTREYGDVVWAFLGPFGDPGAGSAGSPAARVRLRAGVASLRDQEAPGMQLGADRSKARSTPPTSPSCTCPRPGCRRTRTPTRRRTRSACAGSGATRCRSSPSSSTMSASSWAARVEPTGMTDTGGLPTSRCRRIARRLRPCRARPTSATPGCRSTTTTAGSTRTPGIRLVRSADDEIRKFKAGHGVIAEVDEKFLPVRNRANEYLIDRQRAEARLLHRRSGSCGTGRHDPGQPGPDRRPYAGAPERLRCSDRSLQADHPGGRQGAAVGHRAASAVAPCELQVAVGKLDCIGRCDLRTGHDRKVSATRSARCSRHEHDSACTNNRRHDANADDQNNHQIHDVRGRPGCLVAVALQRRVTPRSRSGWSCPMRSEGRRNQTARLVAKSLSARIRPVGSGGEPRRCRRITRS